MRVVVLLFIAIIVPFQCNTSNAQLGWPTYGGDSGGQRFSASSQINRDTVNQVKSVWTFHTHALDHPRMGYKMASFEATPVLLRKTLFLSTPFDEVFGIDATTGVQRWEFDPKPVLVGETNLTTSRGVAVWTSNDKGPCAERVFVGTLDGRLFAVDAANGKPCSDFGSGGSVDMKADVDYRKGNVYEVTSAPTVVGDVIVVGSSIPDGMRVNELRGTVHAYNVRTGALLWTWDPIGAWALKQPEGTRTGSGNAWSTMSDDPKLGLVYVPTGSASPEYFGGLRPGDNRDANSVVALDAKTGKRVWGFQVVHHDLWDYDVAAEPVLFTWHGTIPAIAIGTKMGQVFVLDRRTGTPLFPVEERPVPKSDVPGEDASPTQPFSSLPTVNPTNINDTGGMFERSSEEESDCTKAMQGERYEGLYTPPSVHGSLQYPGSIGGINWGGMAFDPETHLLYANNNSDIYEVDLIPRARMDKRTTYALYSIPGLLDRLFGVPRAKTLLLALAIITLLVGSGMRRSVFPGVPALSVTASLILLIAIHHLLYLRNPDRATAKIPVGHINASRLDSWAPQTGTPYWMHVKPLSDRHGRPCAKLPWGALTAINLETGKLAFRVPHGPGLDGQQTGSLSVSGPIVTRGGLILSAGTREPLLYVYDAKTGAQLAQLPLPGPAQATPLAYELDGKEYVVIAAGGHGPLEIRQGDSVVAFALPNSVKRKGFLAASTK